MKVLITGASGNLGYKIRAYLQSFSDYELVLLDIDGKGDSSVIEADLSLYEETWAKCFADVQAVLHLAANPHSKAMWGSIQRLNVDLLLNVFEASVLKGVQRFVFASSNHVMAGYQNENVRITPQLQPRPTTFYGMSKVVGERIGKNYSDRHDLSVVCLRIGHVRKGDNASREISDLWLQKMWLSNRDLCQLAEKSIRYDGIRKFVVLNAMSDNANMRWDLTDTRRILGYAPQDGCS